MASRPSFWDTHRNIGGEPAERKKKEADVFYRATTWCFVVVAFLRWHPAAADPATRSHQAFSIPAFAEYSFSVPPGTKEIRVGDFNGDGFRDLLYLADLPRRLWIGWGKRSGTFQRPEGFSFEEGVPLPEEIHRVFVQDCDADGKEEIVYPVRGRGGGFRTLWQLAAVGISEGKIRLVRLFPLPDRSWIGGSSAFFFRDVDGDHIPDMVVADEFLNRFLVWKGPAYLVPGSQGRREVFDRAFSTRDIPIAVGSPPLTLTIADVDGDGSTDIVRVGPDRFLLKARRGRAFSGGTPGYGYGNFELRRTVQTVPAVFTRDGTPDLLTIDENGIARVLVSSWGSWFAESFFLRLSPRSAVLPGDFNGDGIDDLLLFTSGDRSFAILINDGTGRFAGAVAHAAVRGPLREVLVADLDGNGADDLLALLYDGKEGHNAVGFVSTVSGRNPE